MQAESCSYRLEYGGVLYLAYNEPTPLLSDHGCNIQKKLQNHNEHRSSLPDAAEPT